MRNKNHHKEGSTWHANASSGGTLDLSLYFPPEKGWSDEDQQKALALALSQAQDFMLQKGYLLPDSRFLSPRDIATEYGHSRQYWEKLLKEGKIPYKKTAAGMITTDLWVQGYLQNKERVDEYVRNCRTVLRRAEENKSFWGNMECPHCSKNTFRFTRNLNNVNGVCDSGCGFQVYTTREAE